MTHGQTTRAAALDELAAALVRDPAVRDAHCAGQPDLMAGEIIGESTADRTARHQRALALCRGCPAATACARIAGTLRPRDLDGVWSGQVWNHGRPADPTYNDPGRTTGDCAFPDEGNGDPAR